jgi:hypothetical protein
MCENESSSREHVPPKCFFPSDQNANLITVPSCSEHNLEKSKDDEYVRLIISASFGANEIGLGIAKTKGLRSLQRSPKFISTIFDHAQVLNLRDGRETISNEVDLDRWSSFFNQFSNAVYFLRFW